MGTILVHGGVERELEKMAFFAVYLGNSMSQLLWNTNRKS